MSGSVYWYQCMACRKFVNCELRLDDEKIREIKKKGDCADYVFSSTTRYRSSFR